MATDPFALFDEWLADARSSEPNDPEAMALATAGPDGQPHARMVLLKGHASGSFIFYTNEQSAKGEELEANPRAALLFHWKSLRRQVRIEGPVGRVPDERADAYFASRARDSQLGAWASQQSRPLENRDIFEQRFEEMKRRFDGVDVPRPDYWVGYRLAAERMEFWQDRPHRLHERKLFIRSAAGWDEGLLYP